MTSALSNHLVERGLLSADRIDEASRRQALAGGTLDTALLEQGFIAEPGMLQALADVSGIRPVNLADFEPNPQAAALIPSTIAEKLVLVPLSLDGEVLHVACTFPPPTQALTEVGLLLNRRLELWVALECRVREWMSSLYGAPLPARMRALLAAIDPRRSLVVDEPTAEAGSDEPILLEQKKVRGTPASDEPMATVVLDVSGYGAFAKQVSQEEPDAHEETWTLRTPQAPLAHPVGRHPAWEVPMPPVTAELPTERVAALQVGTAEALTEPELPAAEAPPPWTLDQARAALKDASRGRDTIVEVALRYALRTFDFVAAFAVLRGAAVGWDARGQGASKERLEQLSIPLDAASVFRTVATTRSSYVGPVPNDALTRRFLEQLGRSPRSLFLYPVEVKARLVAVVYGDAGQRPVSQRGLSEYLLFCHQLTQAFSELILYRKQQSSPSQGDEPTGLARVGWSPASSGAKLHLGRAAALPPLPSSHREQPPADFKTVLKRLTGPDAPARARAIAELARTPEASAKELARVFPGPTAWSRLPVVELPEADELGPVPAALVRMGRPAAQALLPLLENPSVDVRYFALLTAGNLPYPELVDGVRQGLFDFEPEVASAARAAAVALRRLPRFLPVMSALREELGTTDPLKQALAARALGVLHDRESLERLIQMTGSSDAMCAQAAAEALRELTKESFGPKAKPWTAWWLENKGRRRADWLLAALSHREFDVRLAAIEELSKALNDNLGYFADGPPAERDAAVARWAQALSPRVRGPHWDLF